MPICSKLQLPEKRQSRRPLRTCQAVGWIKEQGPSMEDVKLCLDLCFEPVKDHKQIEFLPQLGGFALYAQKRIEVVDKSVFIITQYDTKGFSPGDKYYRAGPRRFVRQLIGIGFQFLEDRDESFFGFWMAAFIPNHAFVSGMGSLVRAVENSK
jgi:hypothetical protein